MFKKGIWMITAVVVLSMLIGCGKEEVKPKAINEETDKCATCNMMVANVPGSTQIVLESGKSMMFDDLGCLVKWKQANPDEKIAEQFVRDFHTLKWVSQQNATYVYDASFVTPMAYGVLSFAKKADAEAYVDEQGKGIIMTAKQLEKHTWTMNKEMMKMHADDMHEEDTHEDEMKMEESAM